MRRGAAAVALLLVSSVLLSACAKRSQGTDTLRAALSRTIAQARHFHYVEQNAGPTVSIDGAIEDDLRYQADLSLGATAAESEVVSDDAYAVRWLNFDLVTAYAKANPVAQLNVNAAPGGPPSASPSASASASASPASGGAPAASPVSNGPSPALTEALRSGRWVVDKHGAADLLVRKRSSSQLGQDPVFDALTVLNYVDRAINEARDVIYFNPESLEYRPAEDPFPRPNRAAGEVRYDLVPFDLPPPDPTATVSGKIAALPRPAYFRKMSVYVRAGKVFQVREVISVKARLQQANNDLVSRVNEVASTRVDTRQPVDVQAKGVAQALEQYRKQTLADPLRERSLVYDLTDLGGHEKVAMPADAVEEAFPPNLLRGQVLQQRGT
ncbi:MAG: hypothetical protein ABR598_02285 [Candidatus Dormibacteria bacterium]